MFCYVVKQHFATPIQQTVAMEKGSIRDVLAANLQYYMIKKGLTQKALGKAASMGQTTVSLYLSPERRKLSKSGKVAAPNLGQVEQMANALGVQLWELLRPMTPSEREAYEQIEAAFLTLKAKPAPAEPQSRQETVTENS